MKTIVLPTDFSDNSWNAISYALQLFKDEPCHFLLLNTYTPIIHNMEYAMSSSIQFELGNIVKEASQKGLSEIEQKIEEQFSNPKHSFESIAAFNLLIPEIKDITENKPIDYVIMGTKGATGAQEILFGSNTVHVFKNIKCPVLAIPDNYKFKAVKDILFPSDYEVNFSDKHIQPISTIAKQYQSRVHVLHVSHEFELSESMQHNKTQIANYLTPNKHVFHNVPDQTVMDAITNFQSETSIELLVMVNNKHSFFENLFFKSTLNQIGFHLNIPFLVIPSTV